MVRLRSSLLLLALHSPPTPSAASAQLAPAGRFGHVERAGSGPTTLVLVPCLGCDWRSFDEFMSRNRSRYTMYAVTWPGMGDTPMPALLEGDTALPLHRNLDRAMERLIAAERIRPVILAHSAAAVHAIRFAAEHPALVAGVINVDAVITNWDWFGFDRRQRDSAAAADMAPVRAAYDSDSAWVRFNRQSAATIRRADRREFYLQMWLRPDREAVFRYWEEWYRDDVGRRLSELKVPVLSIYVPGEGDAAPEHIRERFRRNHAGPNFSLRFVPGAEHAVWESNPEEFDAMVAEFVRSLP